MIFQPTPRFIDLCWNRQLQIDAFREKYAYQSSDMPSFYGIIVWGLMLGVWRRRLDLNSQRERFLIKADALQENGDSRLLYARVNEHSYYHCSLTSRWNDVVFFDTWHAAQRFIQQGQNYWRCSIIAFKESERYILKQQLEDANREWELKTQKRQWFLDYVNNGAVQGEVVKPSSHDL